MQLGNALAPVLRPFGRRKGGGTGRVRGLVRSLSESSRALVGVVGVCGGRIQIVGAGGVSVTRIQCSTYPTDVKYSRLKDRTAA